MIIKPRSSSVNAYIDILVCGLVFTVVCLACLARLGVVLMVVMVMVVMVVFMVLMRSVMMIRKMVMVHS